MWCECGLHVCVISPVFFSLSKCPAMKSSNFVNKPSAFPTPKEEEEEEGYSVEEGVDTGHDSQEGEYNGKVKGSDLSSL